MDHPLIVRELQRVGHLPYPAGDLFRGQSAFNHAIVQRVALHVGHYQVDEAARFSIIGDGDNARVFEPGDQAGLAPEAADESLICADGRGENLDGYLVQVACVETSIYRGHSALADLFDQAVGAEHLPNQTRHAFDPEMMDRVDSGGSLLAYHDA